MGISNQDKGKQTLAASLSKHTERGRQKGDRERERKGQKERGKAMDAEEVGARERTEGKIETLREKERVEALDDGEGEGKQYERQERQGKKCHATEDKERTFEDDGMWPSSL